jgi:hypothetical protein
LLYRYLQNGVAQGEAAVNAATAAASEFVTFAEMHTGVAWANPSNTPAFVTITALDATGAVLGSTTQTLLPNAHWDANIGPLLNLTSFSGSVHITSTVPIVSLSLNAKMVPVFRHCPRGTCPTGLR